MFKAHIIQLAGAIKAKDFAVAVASLGDNGDNRPGNLDLTREFTVKFNEEDGSYVITQD